MPADAHANVGMTRLLSSRQKSHRIHINLHLDRLIIGILLEQTNLLRNQLLHFLGVLIPPKLHYHLLDIQILDP